MKRQTNKFGLFYISLCFLFSCNPYNSNNAPAGVIDFKNKKIVLAPNHSYTFIDVYWEGYINTKNEEKINISSNEISFDQLKINDSVSLDLLINNAKLIQIQAGTDKLGLILGKQFQPDTITADQIILNPIIE
jgi:hypothetical protein